MCVCVYILLVCKLDIRDSRIDVVYYIVYAEICWGEYVPGPLVNDSEAARVVCVVPHFTSSHPTPSTKVPHRHFPPTHRTLYSYHPLRMQYPSMHPYHPMSLTLAPSTPHTSQLSPPPPSSPWQTGNLACLTAPYVLYQANLKPTRLNIHLQNSVIYLYIVAMEPMHFKP